MKKLLLPALIFSSIFLLNCTKDEEGVILTNCDGIITDTLGTSDTSRLYMPNAFTPNDDGLNDSIKPFAKDISTISFIITDENNNVLFSTNQVGQGWPGSPTATSGSIYYYKIQATTSENHHIGKCGGIIQLTCFPPNKPVLFFGDQLTSNGFTGPTLDSLATCP